jgi:hypothetical protein
MNILFAQQWNVNRDKEADYLAFIVEKYFPGVVALGLKIVGGYYVEVGAGPGTVGVLSSDSLEVVNEAVVSPAFRQLTNELSFFISDRQASLGISTGRVSEAEYTIQEGVWKWNHYYNVRSQKKNNYKQFIKQLAEAFAQIDYVELTQEWHMLYGGRGDYLLEMTFKDPVDIARLLNNQQFRELEKLVKKDLITNYSSRIMRSTEKFDKPRWITL